MGWFTPKRKYFLVSTKEMDFLIRIDKGLLSLSFDLLSFQKRTTGNSVIVETLREHDIKKANYSQRIIGCYIGKEIPGNYSLKYYKKYMKKDERPYFQEGGKIATKDLAKKTVTVIISLPIVHVRKVKESQIMVS